MMFKKFYLFSIFLLLGFCAFAQGAAPQINVSVDKTSVDASQEINLTITVTSSSADVEVTELPSLPNFNIYSSGTSRRTTMAGGKVTSVNVFTFILLPRFAGKSVIDSFTVKVAGKEFKTEHINVEVTRSALGSAQASLSKKSPAPAPPVPVAPAKPAAQPSPDIPDFFMTAVVDKTTAFLNEPITLRIRFYQAASTLGNPQYTRPKLEGLVAEEVKANQGYDMVHGRQYRYTEFISLLFGITAGDAVIGPAMVEYAAAEKPGDAFDFFLTNSYTSFKKVLSDPLKITVLPLPTEGRPPHFFNAAGRNFSISANVDNTAPLAGEPVTLTVTINGTGNINAIGEMPSPDLGPSFRVYETTSSASSKITDGSISGTKVYKTVLVPRASGRYTIPAIHFAYFDFDSKTFRTITAHEIQLNVKPAAAESAGGGSVSFAGEQAAITGGARVEKLGSDIIYLKTPLAPSAFTLATGFIAGQGRLNYLSFALVFIVLLIIFFKNTDIDFLDRRKAYMRARRALSKAKSMDDVSSALFTYLEDKQGSPLGLMTVSDVISKFKLEEDTSRELSALWASFEMLKYAPASSRSGEVAVGEAAKKVLKLIRDMEKEIK